MSDCHAALCAAAHGVAACAVPTGLERLLAAATCVEDGDPLAGTVVAEAHMVALAAHADYDVADAAPVGEAAVHE